MSEGECQKRQFNQPPIVWFSTKNSSKLSAYSKIVHFKFRRWSGRIVKHNGHKLFLCQSLKSDVYADTYYSKATIFRHDLARTYREKKLLLLNAIDFEKTYIL